MLLHFDKLFRTVFNIFGRLYAVIKTGTAPLERYGRSWCRSVRFAKWWSNIVWVRRINKVIRERTSSGRFFFELSHIDDLPETEISSLLATSRGRQAYRFGILVQMLKESVSEVQISGPEMDFFSALWEEHLPINFHYLTVACPNYCPELSYGTCSMGVFSKCISLIQNDSLFHWWRYQINNFKSNCILASKC